VNTLSEDKDQIILDLRKEHHEEMQEWAKLHSKYQEQKQANEKLMGVMPEEEEDSKEYLNLLIDIKRVDSVIRRLDRRGRKSKSDDVMAKCAGVMAILEGKKLLLIQAVTHTTKKIKIDKRYNVP